MTLPDHNDARATPTRLAGLDVLRAFAVAAVVAYHVPLNWAKGGFIGVDIFFVISGFLITSLLITEYRRERAIDLRAFWARRARRLLPATIVLLALTAVALLTIERETAQSQRGDIAAALFYVSNWYQIFAERSYFEAFGRPPILRHLWSLAIEEQFYLVWPVFMMVLLRRCSRKVILAVLSGAALASAVAMALAYSRWVSTTNPDPSSIYLRTDLRVQAMVVGAACAVWRWPRLFGRRAARVAPSTTWDIVGALGFVVLLGIIATATEATAWMYRGGFLLVALSTAGLIVSVTNPGSTLWGRLRTIHPGPLRPLQFIGERSYGIYLWHWPIFVFTRPGTDIQGPEWLVHSGRVIATLVVAELSYRFIEQPVRLGTWRRIPVRARWVGAVVSASACLGLVTQISTAPTVKSELQQVLEDNERFLAEGGGEGLTTLETTTAVTSPSTEPGTTATQPPATSESGTPTSNDVADTTTTSTTRATTIPPSTLPPIELGTYRPISLVGLAVGDSVMLGGARALRAAIGPYTQIDAVENRSFIAGIDLVRKAHRQGAIGDVLIMHLGNNGPVTATQLNAFLKELDDVPLIVLVTLKLPGYGFVGGFNSALMASATKFDNVQVADWGTVAAKYPSYLYDDGTHIRPDQARVYSNVITDAVLRACGASVTDFPVTPTTVAKTTTPTTTTIGTTIGTANAGSTVSNSKQGEPKVRPTFCSGVGFPTPSP